MRATRHACIVMHGRFCTRTRLLLVGDSSVKLAELQDSVLNGLRAESVGGPSEQLGLELRAKIFTKTSIGQHAPKMLEKLGLVEGTANSVRAAMTIVWTV